MENDITAANRKPLLGIGPGAAKQYRAQFTGRAAAVPGTVETGRDHAGTADAGRICGHREFLDACTHQGVKCSPLSKKTSDYRLRENFVEEQGGMRCDL